MTIKYIITFRTSRGQRFVMPKSADTLDDAFEIAKEYWNNAIDHNAYVDVRIAQQHK